MVEFSSWQLFQGRDNGPQCEGLDRRMKVVRRREKNISEVPPVASVTCSPILKHAEGLAHMRGGVGVGGAVVLVVLVVVGQFFFSFFHTRTHARTQTRARGACGH